ncbi:hypothetical protein [Aurantiacibacter rhizosphaerae]|uniref:Envelope stress response membrane protein PspB n=1 Tax=Aurantiacibacter rhizosphaerae TaxID=2691582 RepID=A0A844XCK2_9SPHN|nr:hypothetical protein [Aurantiacibacter rhizosphaerae]
MSFWSAIVLIVLITAVAKYLHGRRPGDDRIEDTEHATRREAELEHEVKELRERLQVLERIATDPARRTAEEIEKLRDE